MKTQIVISGLAVAFLILNSPILAVDRLVPSQYSTLEVMPINLNYDAEAYAYADPDETETDTGFSTNGKAQAQAHAHFEYLEPSSPCIGYRWWIEDIYANTSVEGVSGVEGVWLRSTLNGRGEWSNGDECTGESNSGTGCGMGGGYTSLAGTIGIDISFTMKVEAAIDGSSPGAWDSWDWWFKIWDDDANNPIVLLNDSNMSANLEVLAGQILNVELYHEGGTEGWPVSGLESTLTVGLIAGPIMEVSGTEFWFDAQVGGGNPEPQTLSISNSGVGTLNWEIMGDCSWLSAEPNSGSSTGEANEVAVIVDISGLAAGLYNCELTVNGEGAAGSPQIIGVTLYVRESYLHVPGEFGTIQEAIDVAVNCETVLVAPGTYTGAGNKNLDFGGKAITVRSTDPEDPCVVADTVIDCQNSGRGFYFHSNEGPNSVVSGLTITRGYVTGSAATGGGIYCSGSSPTIENCVIRGNRANGSGGSYPGGNGGHGYGGGVYNTSGSPMFVKCTISSNTAAGGRGGDSDDMSSWPGMGGCAYGGGLYGSGITIEDCTLSNNEALGGRAGDDHGMLWSGQAGDAYGGGIYGSLEISSTVISGNTAHGGVFLYDGFPGAAHGGGLCGGSTIENCLIIENAAEDSDEGYWDNSGGGAYGAATITNTTICNNVAPQGVGGIAGAAVVTDCILWGNDDDLGGCAATYSCIEDGDAGEGNIDDDPCFVSGPLGDYYLSQIAAGQAFDSPCVDAGSDTAANLGMDIFTTRTDQIGDAGVVDMGYHYPAPIAADINKDWVVDTVDYTILASQWRQEPGILSADIAPPGGDDKVDEKDLAFLVDNWLWEKQ